jgi:dTMP kinase
VTTARGRLIAFEGGEGTGKSTQAERLATRLGAVLTREPGGTELGTRVRELVLGRGMGDPDPRAEALLMAADRAQHVAEVIRPALAGGRDVVTDRYSGSTFAYQGYGRGFDLDDLVRLSAWASDGLEPDLVILLDVDEATADARRCREPDRLEAAGREFHRRVLDGYRHLAQSHGWMVVDGNGSVDEVEARVAAGVAEWERGRR